MAYPTDALAAQMAQMNTGQQPNPTASAPPAPGQQGYPPPQGYPPQQGFPPQQQGYPAPQQGYPAPQQGYPAPQQQGYPAPQQGYPAPQQHPPPQQQGYPPQQGYAPQPGHAPQPGYAPQGSPQMAHPAPQGLPPAQGPAPVAPQPQVPTSALPAGFSVMDAFRQNNVIQLVSRPGGNTVAVKQGNLRANGDFSKADAQWHVIVETNGTYVLQNQQWPGCHLAIKNKGKELTTKKNDKECQFRVTPMADNYVTFESVAYPGSYIGFTSNGTAKNPKELGPAVQEAQFFVRVLRQKHPFSNPILTPYGRPSVFMNLPDRSVVQLYSKQNNMHAAITGNGGIISTVNGNDPNTFFIWMDHGMGIVSLQSRKYEGYRFRMGGFTLMSKGDPDLNGDFRVKENSDGSVGFESVTCPGGFLGIQNGPKPITNISIYLVTIQKFGKSETITKSAIN